MGAKVYERDHCMEEERPSQPTKEELRFLQLRTKLKQVIRKQMITAGDQPVNNLYFSYDDYGSFFGPSKPTIAPRLLKETSLLLQNPNVAFDKFSNFSHTSATARKRKSTDGSGSKPPASNRMPGRSSMVGSRKKAQMLRIMRDYSFLSSNNNATDIPESNSGLSSNSPPDQKVSASCSVPSANAKNTKDPSAKVQRSRIIKESSSLAVLLGHEVKKAGYAKITCTPSSSMINNGGENATRLISHSAVSQEALPRKGECGGHFSKQSQKPPPHHIQHLKQPKVHKNSVAVPTSLAAEDELKLRHPKRKKPTIIRHHEEEGNSSAKAISIIRKMFHYNPDKYHDEGDDGIMEVANFADIQKEEGRSARIARKEDQEELRKIVVEETRNRLGKKAKKSKLTDS